LFAFPDLPPLVGLAPWLFSPLVGLSMPLVGLSMPGVKPHPAMPYMRWGSHVPILTILVVMFVIPHDPSTSLVNPGVMGFTFPTPLSSVRPAVRKAGPGTLAAHSIPGLRNSTFMGAVAPRAPLIRGQVFISAIKLRRAIRRVQGTSNVLLGTMERSWHPWADRSELAAEDVLNFCSSHEWDALPPTTVEELRLLYGERQHWYGDLNARATRELYHRLIPTQLLNDDSDLPLAQRARRAVAARRAARLYARERTILPVALGSQLVDGVRVLANQGRFQPDGLSEDQIWSKYASQHGVSLHEEGCLPDCLDESLLQTVLRKSCSCNRFVDQLAGLQADAERCLPDIDSMGCM